MHAIQSPKPNLRSVRNSGVAPQVNRRKRHQLHREIALETSVKLVVNVVFSMTALATLTHLLPYQASQQTKLNEIQTEVNTVQGRVSLLQQNLDRGFDPYQARSIMQEETVRVEPSQQRIVWLKEGAQPGDPSRY